MTDAEPLLKLAAKFQSLMRKFAEGDKKDPAKARQYRKLMKRNQRRALVISRRASKVAAKAAAAAPAAPPSETKT